MSQPAKMVAWSDDYNLGLEEIDGQHQYLVDLINQLWHDIVHRAPQDEIMRVLSELEHYTVSHFTAEEVFMRTVDYPEFEQHKGFHKSFTDFIAAEKKKLANGETVSLEVMHYLKEWLLNHILKCDRAYAEYYKKQKAPRGIFARLFGKFGK